MSVFCFFKFFNRRSLSHTIHGIFLHMKLRPVLRFFLILDKNAPVFYRWKISAAHPILPGKVLLFLLSAHLLSNTMGKRLRSGRNHRLHK